MSADGPEKKVELRMMQRSGRLWASYVPDVVLTTAVVLLAVGGPYLVYRAEYVGGLRGVGVGRSFLFAMGLRLLTPFITLAIVIPLAVVRLFDRSSTVRQKFLGLVFPAICLAALLIPMETETGAPVYLRGFGQRMLESADIEAIQRWLATDGAKYAGREYRYSFPSDLPGCLTEFHPRDIVFSTDTPEEGVTVEFRWYAPHGEHFGLIVGPPSMETPKQGVIHLLDSSFSEFRRPVKAGAYVFARG